MKATEKKELIASLEKHGFSPEEIEDVFTGLSQLDNGEHISAEDMYKSLFSEKKVHA